MNAKKSRRIEGVLFYESTCCELYASQGCSSYVWKSLKEALPYGLLVRVIYQMLAMLHFGWTASTN